MQREINHTGLRVCAIGLGAMPLSIQGRPDEIQALEVIRTFIEAGGNFIDTANAYCLDDSDIGHNERLIAKILTQLGQTDRVIVATKGGLRRPKGDWTVDGDPKFLRQSCEQSLRDLGTDCIALYQLHAVDPKIGLLPSLRELIRLREEGKIRHIGLSNVDTEQVRAALAHAPIVSVQNRCNVLEKQDFRSGLVDFCSEHGITYIPHSPVGGHYGHVRLGGNPLFSQLAKKYAATPYGIALAWLLARGKHILPIPGASRPASVVSSMSARSIVLDATDIQAIDRMPDQR